MNPEFLASAIIILLFSVIVHEVMHGYVAKMFGDHTAENMGRLTLNPIPHIDLYGTIIIPFVLLVLPRLLGIPGGFVIGWAKPVPVNPLNFTDIRKGELFVSLAGIISNFALALIAALIYHFFPSPILQFAVGINLSLAVFNFIPIPPLDGSKVLMALLPYHLARDFERLSTFGPLLLLALLYFNILGVILSFIITPLFYLLGVPPL